MSVFGLAVKIFEIIPPSNLNYSSFVLNQINFDHQFSKIRTVQPTKIFVSRFAIKNTFILYISSHVKLYEFLEMMVLKVLKQEE